MKLFGSVTALFRKNQEKEKEKEKAGWTRLKFCKAVSLGSSDRQCFFGRIAGIAVKSSRKCQVVYCALSSFEVCLFIHLNLIDFCDFGRILNAAIC